VNLLRPVRGPDLAGAAHPGTTTEDETMERIKIGDIRRAHGRDYVVMFRERGRGGEARTMVLVGERVGNLIQERETRSRATIAGWPLVGRLRLGPRLGQHGGMPIVTS